MKPLYLPVFLTLFAGICPATLGAQANPHGGSHAEVLTILAQHPDGNVRRALVQAVADTRTRDPDVIALVSGIAEGEDDQYGAQRAAARALRDIMGEEYLPRLRALLASTDRLEQRAACTIISEFGEVAAPLIHELIPFLDEKDGVVRYPARSALVALLPSSADALLAKLDEDSVDILNATLYGRFRETEPDIFRTHIMGVFLDKWRDEGSEVYVGVPYSLYYALELYGDIPELAEVEPLLLAALADRSRANTFISSLGGSVRPSVRPILVKGLHNEVTRGWSAIGLDLLNREDQVSASNHSMVPELIRTLEDPQSDESWELIRATLHALGTHGVASTDAVPIVRTYLEQGEKNHSMRCAAEQTLGLIDYGREETGTYRSIQEGDATSTGLPKDFDKANAPISTGPIAAPSGQGTEQASGAASATRSSTD